MRGELFFEDWRNEAAFKHQMFDIKDFLVFQMREDLMKEFKIAARMLAAGLLALYKEMALEQKARESPLTNKIILSKVQATSPSSS